MSELSSPARRALEALEKAEALIIGAGAGMGVDSGLPDFRGDQGFWKAYPPLAQRGLRFVEMASPRWFRDDPKLAWGFYGHRLALYRNTSPHHGFELLLRRAESLRLGAWIFTSNVDGQFQRAGFAAERIVECHGSLLHLQCSRPCSDAIWPAGAWEPEVDEERCELRNALPRCPDCDAVARPNVLLFGDGSWIPHRTGEQERAFQRWLHDCAGSRLAIVECGAGTAVPTVRLQCEALARGFDAPLVRINPREAEGPAGTLSLPCGALEGLEAIAAERGSS